MKAVILNFTGMRENWGCQATSWNLFRFCKAALQPHGLSSLEIVPLPPGCVQDQLELRRHGARIRDIYGQAQPNRADLNWLEGRVVARFGSIVKRVKAADLVIFQGEGTVGPAKLWRGTKLFGLPFIAKHCWAKPVLSMNQTIYAEVEADVELTRTYFNGFDMVALREATSLEFCKSIGIKNSVLCPDMAFADAIYIDRQIKEQKPPTQQEYFCVTGSAGASNYDADSFASTLEKISRDYSLRPIFIYSRSSDHFIVDAISSKMNKNQFDLITAKIHRNYLGIVPILKGSKFVIGGRYHTSITALAHGVPVIITASNSSKSAGLSELLGIDLPVIDETDRNRIARCVRNILESEEAWKDTIIKAHRKLESRFDEFSSMFLRIASTAIPDVFRGDVDELPIASKMPPTSNSSCFHAAPGLRSRIFSSFVISHNIRHYDIPDMSTSKIVGPE